MGLFSFLWRLFGGGSPTPRIAKNSFNKGTTATRQQAKEKQAKGKRFKKWLLTAKLQPLRYSRRERRIDARLEVFKGKSPPYKFARPSFKPGTYHDLSKDANLELLATRGLPVLRTPEDLAVWLGIPLGKLAWLVNRFTESGKPVDVQQAHYHFRWLKKKKKGYRLLEIPKQSLRHVQDKILSDILQMVKPHSAACGFHPGTSIKMNAAPHVGRELLLKYDLENFYPRMRFSRVVAVYRSLGFSREVSIWLGILCTSATPTR
jgi:hypothetical protein